MRALMGLVILAALVMASSACTGAKAESKAVAFRVRAVNEPAVGPTLEVVEYAGRCFFIVYGTGVTGPFPCEAAP